MMYYISGYTTTTCTRGDCGSYATSTTSCCPECSQGYHYKERQNAKSEYSQHQEAVLSEEELKLLSINDAKASWLFSPLPRTLINRKPIIKSINKGNRHFFHLC